MRKGDNKKNVDYENAFTIDRSEYDEHNSKILLNTMTRITCNEGKNALNKHSIESNETTSYTAYSKANNANVSDNAIEIECLKRELRDTKAALKILKKAIVILGK